MSQSGACIYPGNNCRRKNYTYRENGRLIAYAKVKSASDLDPVVRAAKGTKDLRWYTMVPVAGGAEFEVLAWTSIHKKVSPTWEDETLAKQRAGRVSWEDQMNGSAPVMRNDVGGMFEPAARDLQGQWPGTTIHSFNNVDNDEKDGGTTAETLKYFMDTMDDLPANRDFFAYAGHGSANGLVSACLNRKSKQYSEFVDRLRAILKPNGTIIFYACSTGAVGGFAQKISQDLPGMTVFGHMIPGKATRNPQKARCINGKHETFRHLLGSDYHAWADYIKHSDIWRRYPFMTIDDIKTEVREAAAGGSKKKK